jgi:V8-like Glu-specific endopeptidase
VLARLSQRVRRRLTGIAAVAGPAAGSISKGGAIGNVANVARLIVNASKKSGAEAGAEVDETVASEAAAALEVIIGRDDRVRIRSTTNTPWRRYCALRITFPSGRTFRGSGSLIGSRAVLTAGHCVFMRAEGGWARSVEVIPAMDGATRPYGSAQSSNLRSVVGWTRDQNPEYDYGCIILPQGAFGGRNLGRFGFAALSSMALLAKPVVLAGYPGDKPFAELWGMSRKIKRVTPRTLVYDIDTVGGQSGAPVYLKRNGKRLIVGIHNYGASTGNSATRVIPSVYQRLLAWSQIS